MVTGRVCRRVLMGMTCSLLLATGARAQQPGGYARSSTGVREITLGSGTIIKMLLDASNLGSDEIEVGEITFAAVSSPTAGHRHGATEIFYVIEGVLGHVVNGVEHRLEPGMVGVVKPSDEVMHRVLVAPVRAVVIWVPGGEGNRVQPAEAWRPLGG
ncbi:MAG: cupin domain-containing protein [Gemmatimonadetes bacterium]|nr:cupin domain-containing protein [Gemmatimonadota bacterium]